MVPLYLLHLDFHNKKIIYGFGSMDTYFFFSYPVSFNTTLICKSFTIPRLLKCLFSVYNLKMTRVNQFLTLNQLNKDEA